MADLSFIEKGQIESFLGMKSGYVLDFSDRTFQEFVGEVTGLDILNNKYNYHSGSKANRLSAFLKLESNHTCGILLEKLIEYWFAKAQLGEGDYYSNEIAYNNCLRIIERLKQDSIVVNAEAFQTNNDDRDFKLLSNSIRESINKNEPEVALDRLHTFMIKFIREFCDKYKITYDKNDTLNSIFGKYVKYLSENKLIESIMSERILKYSIHVIEAFNDIRNNKSLAHDNPILNYYESILIFNNIANSIKFIQSIEERNDKKTAEIDLQNSDELPF